MDADCECLFCHRDDLNLYEINQNSVLIGADLVDFREIIFEIFSAHVSIYRVLRNIVIVSDKFVHLRPTTTL